MSYELAPELPLPSFHDPARAADFRYDPDLARLHDEAEAWRRTHRIPPASADRAHTHLLLIDVQRDFCFPEGTLYVGGRSGRGAVEDSARIAAFVYRNLARITQITATFDAHHAFHVFSPAFWEDADGRTLTAHRTIALADIERGAVRPRPGLARWVGVADDAALLAHVRHYCRTLERAGKYTLYLWPPHCIVGSAGQALAGVVQEARMFHAYARGVSSPAALKGAEPLTESYSALRPEVLTGARGETIAAPDTALLQRLLTADRLVVGGQAASHCVKSTLEDLLAAIAMTDPKLADKVYLLTDCMSAVAVPDGKGGFVTDFTAETERALTRFRDAGMHLVTSTEPMSRWPGMPGAAS